MAFTKDDDSQRKKKSNTGIYVPEYVFLFRCIDVDVGCFTISKRDTSIRNFTIGIRSHY